MTFVAQVTENYLYIEELDNNDEITASSRVQESGWCSSLRPNAAKVDDNLKARWQ